MRIAFFCSLFAKLRAHYRFAFTHPTSARRDWYLSGIPEIGKRGVQATRAAVLHLTASAMSYPPSRVANYAVQLRRRANDLIFDLRRRA